jgi:hypothetical protein
VDVSDWATLLPGLAAVITSVGGIGVSVYAIRRASPRERKRAAQGVLDRALRTDDDEDDDEMAALLEEMLHRRRKDDES